MPALRCHRNATAACLLCPNPTGAGSGRCDAERSKDLRATIARLGDAMLSRMLPEAYAGACIPEVAQPCKCGSPCGTTWCTQYRFGCNGSCNVTSTRC